MSQFKLTPLQQAMTASIYPIKYIDATELTSCAYVDDFKIDPLTGDILPPCNNMGGKEKIATISSCCDLTPPSFLVIVDYLSFTFLLPDTEPTSYVEGFLMSSLIKMVRGLKFVPSDKGLYGYKSSMSLTRGDLNVGKIAWNGNRNTCMVSLSGQGCVGVDMTEMHEFIVTLPNCKITRVDLAHDDINPLNDILYYKQLFLDGGFASHGKPPSGRFMDDFDSGSGKTLYVGKKKNGKEACIYEKGKQLGDSQSSWVRVEGRITDVDRVVPFDVILHPDQYLSALYPPFQYLAANQAYIEIITKHTQIAFDSLLEYAGIAYGKLLYYMTNYLNWDADKVVASLIRKGLPSRLAIPDNAALSLVPF